MMCQKIKSLFEYEKLHTNDELYGILDVDEDVSEEEIEITFDELFGILADSDEKDSEEKLAIISDAYGILIDPDERAKLYLKKVINKLFIEWGVEERYSYKKEKLLEYLARDSEIKNKDCFALKQISEYHIIDAIINILDPFEYFVTIDELKGGAMGSCIEHPSGRVICFRIYQGMEDGEVISIGGDLRLVRVRVIPVDAGEMFEFVIKKIKKMFPSRDLSVFFHGLEIKQKNSVRDQVKEQYKTRGYVAAEDLVSDMIRSLLEELRVIDGEPEPEEPPTPAEPIITPPRFVDDYFITKDERRKGSAESVVGEASGMRIKFEIPPGVEDGEVISIEGDANFVRVRVMPVDVDEIFEYLIAKIGERFPSPDMRGFIYDSKQMQKDFLRDRVKEQYMTSGYVAVEEVIEDTIQSLRWELRKFGIESGRSKSISETPVKTKRTRAKNPRRGLCEIWKSAVRWCLSR